MNHTAIINIAKSQLGMDEDDYRAMLVRVTASAVMAMRIARNAVAKAGSIRMTTHSS